MEESRMKWAAYYIIFVALIYPPFSFVNIVKTEYRIASFVILILAQLYLIKYKIIDITYLLMIGLVYFLVPIMMKEENISNKTLYSVLTTMVFGILFSREINNDDRFFEIFLGKLSKVIDVFALMTVLGFIWNQMHLPEINILGIKSLIDGEYFYNYTFSPFGMSFPKEPFGLDTYRSFSYFIEPVYAAPFFGINGFVFKKENTLMAKINNIAGILTFSYLYIILVGYVIISRLKKTSFIIASLMLIGLYILALKYNVFGASSFEERISRINIFFEVFEKGDLSEKIFGLGYGMENYGYGKGISAGLLVSILEIGLIGFVATLAILMKLFRKNLEVFIFAIMLWMAFEVFKFPACWVLLICMDKSLNKMKHFDKLI